jgi:hypothetical protein
MGLEKIRVNKASKFRRIPVWHEGGNGLRSFPIGIGILESCGNVFLYCYTNWTFKRY